MSLGLNRERLSAARRWFRFRAMILLCCSVPTAVWGVLWCAIFISHWALYPTKDVWSELVVVLAVGALPLLGSFLCAIFAVRDWKILADLRAIDRASQNRLALDGPSVAQALGISSERALRLVARGVELDVLADLPSSPEDPAPEFAPTQASQPPQMSKPPQLSRPGSVPHLSGPLGPGSVVGSYWIERRLAEGGMGTVFVAAHVRTGRRYALKTLRSGLSGDPEARARLEREALCAGSLGHPGIAAVHDYGEAPNGEPYLVMDLLEGETLEQHLTRCGPTSTEAALRIGLELASALDAAHSRSLIHRDLKPSNVFLARQGDGSERVILLDFGVAKELRASAARLTRTGEVVGTPLYMAPEQALGQPTDARTDVFGLGAVLFETLSGAPPFIDCTLALVHARLIHESAPHLRTVLPGCSLELDKALAWALEREPARRCPSVRDLALVLRAIHQGSGVHWLQQVGS